MGDSLAAGDGLMLLRNLSVAAAIGLIVGFEREWTHLAEAKPHAFAGARTFTLAGLTGGVSALPFIPEALGAVLLASFALLAIVAHWIDARDGEGRGGTTEIALLLVFVLGYAAGAGRVAFAAPVGVFVALLLSLKKRIVRVATALSDEEIGAILRFLAISVVVLPALPDRSMGPYGALNPREFWWMVVLISGFSFLGYWASRLVGGGRGAFLTGLVGGLASSTATTVSLSRSARDGVIAPSAAAAGVVAANAVMLLRASLILGAISRPALASVWPALAAGGLVAIATAALVERRARRLSGGGAIETAEVRLGNPFELRPAIIFAILLAVVSLASAHGSAAFGSSGLVASAFLAGLGDVDAIILASARQAAEGVVSPATAGVAALVAILANTLVKLCLAAGLGGRALGVPVGAAFLAALCAGVAAAFLV